MYAIVKYTDDGTKEVVPVSLIKKYDISRWRTHKFLVKYMEGDEETAIEARIMLVSGKQIFKII